MKSMVDRYEVLHRSNEPECQNTGGTWCRKWQSTKGISPRNAGLFREGMKVDIVGVSGSIAVEANSTTKSQRFPTEAS